MTDLMSLTKEELEREMEAFGEKAFRGRQLYSWFHQKGVGEYDRMQNLPLSFRQRLERDAPLPVCREVKRLVSRLDGTTKFLFELRDENVIESVWMQYRHGNSVCISSQVGCRMGCRFCASTLGGLVRSLSASEMLMQVYAIQQLTGQRVSHVVVMGTGEPFDNFDNLLRFLTILTSPDGLNISQRNITVSTCGLVERIREFADLKMGVTLAISLHAPNDEMRRELMPVANRYDIREILNACRYYVEKTGRRVTFEYSLVKGQNDSVEHARQLAQRLRGLLCHVNLIPVNPIAERDYEQPNAERIAQFQKVLAQNHINTTIRREMGRDINSACGQLRRKYSKKA